MVIPEKTYTDNPFVDNVIYYAKYLAMNCTVKDEEEAILNETAETLRDGDILISCIESSSTYETFKTIPEVILKKYISVANNLDLYVNNPDTLRIHLSQYNIYDRINMYNRLSAFARKVYIDHYEIMINYIMEVGPSWLDDNEALYNDCVNNIATYDDLFDSIPLYTRKRIIKQYLNNYDITDLENISASLSDFLSYVSSRDDSQIGTELDNISNAMRSVFSSHYKMMKERKYLKSSADKWLDYNNLIKNRLYGIDIGTSYDDLYDIFPKDELLDTLITCIGQEDVLAYQLAESLENLEIYLNDESITNSDEIKDAITKNMWAKYLAGTNLYLSNEIYERCKTETIDYFDLIEYLPKETQKMIINTEIDEITNIDVYSASKESLDVYLNTLSEEDRNTIKESINKDMRVWYPENHIEKNNYYRSLIGLPPLDKNGNPYEDTLVHSYDETTGSYIEFGDKFINLLYSGEVPSKYPKSHWLQNIYELDSYDIATLMEYDIIDKYIEACGSSINNPRYRYLKYLTDNKLNLYQCRKAYKFDLIGIPTIDDEDAKKRFVDTFNVNRDYCIRVVYSEAHKFQSDYYDKFMIIFIIINTIMDMLSGITSMIIDREVFDSRCIKWLFESFGVPYYSEIPIKYLRAMLKNLNTLLKYKSSTKNMIDICKLFGFSDIRVFGYYLFKERNKDLSGNFELRENNDISYDLNELWVRDINGSIEDFNGVKFTRLLDYSKYNEDTYTKKIVYEENGEIKSKRIINNDADVYIKDPSTEYNDFIPLKDTIYFKNINAKTQPATIKFIKVPINESLTAYKNDPSYICSYDDVVYEDEENTWDGGRNHEDLYQEIAEYDFNADKSKYISVEAVTDLTEQTFQTSYFYNMLFDNLYSEDALTLLIPYVRKDHVFRFTDVICYLFALMYFYNGLEDNIMYSPTQILYVKGYNFNEALNSIINDSSIFYNGRNIFNINKKIAEENYDYQEAFSNRNIKAFNLNVDIDTLDKELYEEYGVNLDDFIVDDSLTDFNQIITVRQFFSLNNSYYEKDIFRDNVVPIAYNQNIKSSYELSLCPKRHEKDLDGQNHYYIIDDGNNIEIIDSPNEELYILNNSIYIVADGGTSHSVFTKYVQQPNGNYSRIDSNYYFYNSILDTYQVISNDNVAYIGYDSYNYISYLLVLQNNNDYKLFELVGENYIVANSENKQYVYNSDNENITVLITNYTYEYTKSMAVVFNKSITPDGIDDLEEEIKYNPEESDNKWDENDWFYDTTDDSNTIDEIGMRGENIWYYHDPEAQPEEEAEKNDNIANSIGSGFYIESSAYLGDIQLEQGEKYYMSFDIETNFSGRIQIYNTADISVNSIEDRVYDIIQRSSQHISQTFIASGTEQSDIMFLIYDFEQYPIKAGDFIIIRNISIMKAYSDNFIPRDIPSYDKIKELYKTNEAIYKYLVDCMHRERDYDKYIIYKKIYDSLMLSKYNKEVFKIGDNEYAKTYTDFLRTRDTVLYSNLINLKELEQDTMHKKIADEIVEIVYAINDCIDTYSYGFIYSYFPGVSTDYIQQYITKIINWFKSWKVHLLGVNTAYKFGDNNETAVKILERKEYKNKISDIKQNAYIHDTVKINPYDDTNISGIPYSDIYDFDNCESSYIYDVQIKDRIRIIRDLDSSSTNNEFESIDENNLYTSDYIEWSGIDE